MKNKITPILTLLFFLCSWQIGFTITSEQHAQLLEREDYKLSYEFFDKELNALKKRLPSAKYGEVANAILSNIDLEIKYIAETHPFYDLARMYAIIYASKALQLKWLEDFLEANKNYTPEQFTKFVDDLNLPNVYNYVAKTMETPDEFAVINDLPIQCSYEKDFSSWNKNLASASKWLYSISTVDPTFISWIAGAILNAGAFIDRQEFRCHFRANVKRAKIYYFYKGMLSDFYQIENEEIGKKQFATGINFNTHTVKSNLVAIGVETTQEINGNDVNKFTVYQIDRGNQDLIRVDSKHFVDQVMPHFKLD